MPKFSTTKQFFDALLGEKLPLNELEQLLVYAKAELDDYNNKTDEIKLELNDTNRPDLWSAAGLARQLRSVRGKKSAYSFFSNTDTQQPHDERIIKVEPKIKQLRPFIVGFEARGPAMNDVILKEIIRTQERLAWNYGRKRKTIAVGIYPAKQIRYPLHYRACDPQETRFTPLGMQSPLSLRDILATHPKGREFGGLIRDLPAYPCIVDDSGVILSMPPVINSAKAGEVRIGDRHLFVELTGDNLSHLHTANNIIACDLADMGFTISPLRIEYADQHQQPACYTTPHNFHHSELYQARIERIHALLGLALTEKQITDSISRLGMVVKVVPGGMIEVDPPPWRNDYLHEVDIIEDVMIGTGVEQFTPLPSADFTVGKLLPIELLSRQIVRIMVGLGFQEMIHSYLVADEDFIQKMYPHDQWIATEKMTIRIANPRSERHNIVRGSIIPSLLGSCAVSAHAVLPHKIFEIGKIAVASAEENYGSRTDQVLGIVHSAVDEQFTTINEQLSAIMYYLGVEYRIEELHDPRFIIGRAATVYCGEQAIGVLGELHPQVLENWHINTPTTACEIRIDPLLAITGSTQSVSKKER